ncbi:pleckstrin y domain-containing family G member 4B [Caerostris extrusa]|uniref:Pleckstrin y domain-containing family G member 4B n=1 Tax=Caerostris extrusa TaxID=172846 RepID=A0AAV4XMJ0_CAEEX|nr:pleckstrin y domain-containing family G member 4B [Caerostris extrusa]
MDCLRLVLVDEECCVNRVSREEDPETNKLHRWLFYIELPKLSVKDSEGFCLLVGGIGRFPIRFSVWVVDRGRRAVRIDDHGLVSGTMDWMQAIGSDVMINDDQLTAALQHLLVSVEKVDHCIERLEWNSVPKVWTSTAISGEASSTFPRCCHIRSHPVDTKDSSVQTSPEDESSQEEGSSVDKDSESLNNEDTVVHGRYACVQQDSQTVSVVRKNYIPTCESIATQTSSALSPSKATGKPSSDLMFALPPIAVRDEDPDDGYCEHVLTQPATISQVDPDLLHSEVALLPGCRDIKGRSI